MKKIKKIALFALAVVMTIANVQKVSAKENVYMVDISGYYRSPLDSEIEDSGGEDQYALGQSMVEGVVETTGLLEQVDDESYAVYIRFNLMDNISDVSFWTAGSDDDSWTSAKYVEIASTEDTSDFYVPVPEKDSYLRAECYVEPMGRSVIFYIGYDNLQEGNSSDFELYVAEDDSTSSGSGGSSDNGMIIGYADDADEESGGTSEMLSADTKVIDDSIWMILFAVVFIATFTAGLLLILVVLLIRKIHRSHEEIREKTIKKYDKYEADEVDEEVFDFAEIDL